MNFGYILLGLAFVLISWGSWAIMSAFFDRTKPETKRLGKLLRGMVTELLGLTSFLGGYFSDTKASFAFLVFFGALFLGSGSGMFHAVLSGRRSQIEANLAQAQPPSEETQP
ncbi:MAG: hypothetical protein JNJ45_02135 [Chthonomonas sp.]|nr:hypothetical protein [Chthonomonas sp.]